MLSEALPKRYLRIPNVCPQRCSPSVFILSVIQKIPFCASLEPAILTVDGIKETLDSLGRSSKQRIIRILRLDYCPLFDLCG